VDNPQELLKFTRHHCQAIQTIIDQLTEIKSNTELRLLSQRLQRLARDLPQHRRRRGHRGQLTNAALAAWFGARR
jgi:hypothetical protein